MRDIVPMHGTLYVCGMQATCDTSPLVQSSPPLAHHATARHAIPGMECYFRHCSDSDCLFIYLFIFRPTLDSDNAIVHVEEETLTEAYMDSLVTVDACFKYLKT